MKRKIVVPALFCLSLLLVLSLSAASTQAQPETNNWGVSAGDKVTYTITTEYKGTGSGKEVFTTYIKVVRVDDFLNDDNISDLVLTLDSKDGAGNTNLLARITVNGAFLYSAYYLILGIYFFPMPVTRDEATNSGLNWTAAIETINTATSGDLVDYNATVDDDKVIIETAKDRPHLEINGTDDDYGADYDVEKTIKYNMKTGWLEEGTSVTTYNESYGIIIEEKITKGGPGIMDTLADNAIAIAAVGVAVLALLIALIKKE